MQRDYLLEMIERAGETLAAMVTGRDRTEERASEVDVEVAFDREFGHLHLHLRQVDAASAALLLRPPRRVRLYALMLIELAARDGAGPEALSRRALELLLAADALDPAGSEPALLAALAASVDLGRLEPDARAGLARSVADPGDR